ncbi:CopG family transcriptional regulator [Nonomuraea sp. B1E8]|uniref:ribbon-helix-helix domain-containing protein n=1 Tax=unclassified Nonomuraea TaxID=2593643 RepID=UPI00325D9379
MPEVSLYLPEDVLSRVAEAARAHEMSEGDYIREAVTRALAEEIVGERPRPRLPLFDSGDPSFAGSVDDVLARGFGRDGLD